MTTPGTIDPVPVDPVHAGPENPWDPPPGWRSVAGDSAVWHG